MIGGRSTTRRVGTAIADGEGASPLVRGDLWGGDTTIETRAPGAASKWAGFIELLWGTDDDSVVAKARHWHGAVYDFIWR